MARMGGSHDTTNTNAGGAVKRIICWLFGHKLRHDVVEVPPRWIYWPSTGVCKRCWETPARKVIGL